MRDGKRFIYIAELVRVFGEPSIRPETDTADTRNAGPAGEVTGGTERAELIEELRERVKRAEALADAERGRADNERERADRYEKERDAAIARLLPPAPKEKRPGLLRRMFG